MAITRTAPYGAPTDDDGTGTSGTILDAAFWSAFLDLLDGRWSVCFVSSTGTQNNLSIADPNGKDADLVIFTNATDLTITGIAAPASPAKFGKPLRLLCMGAGNVFLSHLSASSTSTNRIVNRVTSGLTPLAGIGSAVEGGSAVLSYSMDSTLVAGTARWRLQAHEQGGWITYVPTGTATTGTWTIDNPGDITSARYRLDGKTLTIELNLVTTTTSNSTLAVVATMPGTYTAIAQVVNPIRGIETATEVRAIMFSNSGSSQLSLQRADSTNWSALTNNLSVEGEIEFDVL